MEFDQALRLSRRLEETYSPQLIIVGLRRQEMLDEYSWAIYIANPRTAQLVTIEDSSDVEARIPRLLSEGGLLDGRTRAPPRTASHAN